MEDLAPCFDWIFLDWMLDYLLAKHSELGFGNVASNYHRDGEEKINPKSRTLQPMVWESHRAQQRTRS